MDSDDEAGIFVVVHSLSVAGKPRQDGGDHHRARGRVATRFGLLLLVPEAK